MRDMFKKDPDPETNKTTSIQNEQETPREPKITQTTEETEQIDYPQFEQIDFPKFEQIGYQQFEESPNATDVLDLLESLEKMRTEEQRLIEIKEQILTKQHDLERKLLKEIEEKKITIANLTLEIPDLQNRCKQLGQALGADIHK